MRSNRPSVSSTVAADDGDDRCLNLLGHRPNQVKAVEQRPKMTRDETTNRQNQQYIGRHPAQSCRTKHEIDRRPKPKVAQFGDESMRRNGKRDDVQERNLTTERTIIEMIELPLPPERTNDIAAPVDVLPGLRPGILAIMFASWPLTRRAGFLL
jgi:hypothetical protein